MKGGPLPNKDLPSLVGCGWSYKWCNYYTTVGYQTATDEKAGVIETANQNTSIDIDFAVKNMLCFYQPQISRFWKIYFEGFQDN